MKIIISINHLGKPVSDPCNIPKVTYNYENIKYAFPQGHSYLNPIYMTLKYVPTITLFIIRYLPFNII